MVELLMSGSWLCCSQTQYPRGQTIGCGEEDEAVVSLMLPNKQQEGGAEPSLTSIDEVFVVVLKPGKQYTTYSCGLDKPVWA